MNSTQQVEPPPTVTTSLDRIDEQRIINRIARDGDYTPEVARRIFVEVVRFLRMVGCDRDAPSVPSKMIDDGWHIFILYTALYRKFCLTECGRFIDHNPHDDPRRRTPLPTCAMTIRYMRKSYISFDEMLWNIHNIGECDESCSFQPQCQGDCD